MSWATGPFHRSIGECLDLFVQIVFHYYSGVLFCFLVLRLEWGF